MLTIRIGVGIRVGFDVGTNDGGFSVFVFGIRLLRDKLYFKHFAGDESDAEENDMVVECKSKVTLYHLNTDKSDKRSVVRAFDIDLVPPFKLKDVTLDVLIGKRNDAMLTTAAVCFVRCVSAAIIAKLKASQNVDASIRIIPQYNFDVIKIDVVISADITAGELIFYAFKYVIIKIKEAKKHDHTTRRAPDRANNG